jgi:hypothetical protein
MVIWRSVIWPFDEMTVLFQLAGGVLDFPVGFEQEEFGLLYHPSCLNKNSYFEFEVIISEIDSPSQNRWLEIVGRCG